MEFSLAAAVREGVGKQKVVKLRQNGQVPGVMYGEGKEAEPLSVDAHDLQMIFLKGGAARLINLKVKRGKKEESEHVLIKDYQRHPVKANVIHVDFLRVAMDHQVTVKTPVHLVNEEKRPRDGAILELVLHELEVGCLPSNIPERILIDVSKLTIGSGIHVKDVVVPEGIRILNAADEVIVLAGAPVTAAETPVAGSTQPEVVGGKKEDAKA